MGRRRHTSNKSEMPIDFYKYSNIKWHHTVLIMKKNCQLVKWIHSSVWMERKKRPFHSTYFRCEAINRIWLVFAWVCIYRRFKPADKRQLVGRRLLFKQQFEIPDFCKLYTKLHVCFHNFGHLFESRIPNKIKTMRRKLLFNLFQRLRRIYIWWS